MFFSATSSLPFMSHSTSAVWPSAETWSPCAGSSGERKFLIVLNGVTVVATSAIAARNARAPDRERLALDEHELRLRVGLAEAGLLEDLVGAMRLADVRVLRRRSSSSADCVAMPNATTTNASQPKTAVFQWLALQRPMRAAMLFECFRGDIAAFRSGCEARYEPRSGATDRKCGKRESCGAVSRTRPG